MSHSQKRIFGLDLMRCIAILLVLFTHSFYILDRKNIYFKVPVYTGFTGVEIFFILSGFLIGTILLKINETKSILKFNDLKNFWIRRWFRTLPNYYLMFAVYGIIFYLKNHIVVLQHLKYASYLVFLQNTFSYHPDDFFPVAWSLSVEEWFYILFPTVLFIISRLNLKDKKRIFLATILFFLIVSLAARLFSAITFNTQWDAGFRKFVPLRLDGIGFGVLIAYVKFYHPSLWQKHKRQLFIIGAVIFGICIYLFSQYYVSMFDPIDYDKYLDINIFIKSVFFTSFSLAIALMLPLLHSIKLSGQNVVTKGITLISEASYSIYLIHLLIIMIVSHIIKSNDVLLFAASWVTTILVSIAQYELFEKKMTSLRNRFGTENDKVGIS